MREFVIQTNEAGQRFDKYLKKLLCSAPSCFLYKMLRKNNIVLIDKKAAGTERLQLGDNVKLYLSEETYLKFSAAATGWERELPIIYLKNLPFSILYEDDDMLVIDKPAGMLSQKAKPDDISANEYILAYLLASGKLRKEEGGAFRPSICNRLDRNTSGVLIAGKTLYGLQEISSQLKERRIEKYYRCIVEGQVSESAHIKGYLHKDPKSNQVSIGAQSTDPTDKWIETAYTPIHRYANATLLEVQLITGRTHQIRAHLASIGHPVLGDVKYGARQREDISWMLLHAYRIRMADGREILAPLPKRFEHMTAVLERE